GDIVNIEIGSNIYKAGISIDVIRVGNEEIISDRSLSFESIVGENESKKRVRKVLESINYLTDYSKQSRLLTDFTPDIIAIALQTRYSHRLQKLFEIIEGRKLNVKRVRDVLQDLRANNDKIF